MVRVLLVRYATSIKTLDSFSTLHFCVARSRLLATQKMFSIDWLRLLVSWGNLPLVVLLSVIITWQKLYRDLPLFFSFVIVTTVLSCVRLVVFIVTRPLLHVHPFVYSYTYWISSLVISMFGLLAVYEIFVKRLFAGFYKVRVYRYLFPAVALGIMLLAIVTAWFSPDQPWKIIGTADRIAVLVRLILLGFCTLLMIIMGRTWTRHEFAMVFGWGIISATSLFTSAMWVKKVDKESFVSYLPTIAWDAACIIWLIAFGKPAKLREQEPVKPIDSEVLEEAKKWEGTLKEWLATPKKKQQ